MSVKLYPPIVKLTDFVGFILTMSPTAGISFPDISLPEVIQKPPNAGAEGESLNVLEYLRNAYHGTGTDTWPAKTAEWFVVRLITKVLVVPHGLHSGSTIPEIQKAYLPLVRDLVCRRGFLGKHAC